MSTQNTSSEERLARIEKNLDRVAESLVVIARVDERSAETKRDVEGVQGDVKDHDKRITAIEVQMPQVVETSRVTRKALWGVLGVLGAAALGFVLENIGKISAIFGG